MNVHYINWLEVLAHVTSGCTGITLGISLAHRLVQMAYESFSVEYPDATLVRFISPDGRVQKALRASGDFFGHIAQAGKEFIAPKRIWDGVKRRGVDKPEQVRESQAHGAGAGQ